MYGGSAAGGVAWRRECAIVTVGGYRSGRLTKCRTPAVSAGAAVLAGAGPAEAGAVAARGHAYPAAPAAASPPAPATTTPPRPSSCRRVEP